MHDLLQLQKQQVGLRLPKYLLDEIDNLTKEYALNRTDIITEAITAYIQEQKQKKLLEEFSSATIELKNAMQTDAQNQSLHGLIDELRDN